MKCSWMFLFLTCVGPIALNATEPTWAAIMTLDSSTSPYCGSPYNENCGQYRAYNSSVTQYEQKGLTAYHTFNLPVDGMGQLVISPWVSDVSPCGSTSRPPGSLLRSYHGPIDYGSGGRYKGLNVLARFAVNTGDITSASGDAVLEEAVFFHEDQCYGTGTGNGREYGIVLNNLDGQVYFYWCTLCNGAGAIYNHYIPPNQGTYYTDYTLWYAMWPEDDGNGNCHFVTRIQDQSYNAKDAQSNHDVNYDTYTNSYHYITTSVDTGFCAAIEAEQGYVTAAIKSYGTTLTMSRTDRNYLLLSNPSIYVGK